MKRYQKKFTSCIQKGNNKNYLLRIIDIKELFLFIFIFDFSFAEMPKIDRRSIRQVKWSVDKWKSSTAEQITGFIVT